ncbi:gp53-like domain-containing protein [Pantoea piersonii]|jgi:hypothetical protein|uniref:gp53-like domain-containing protein n=1 Tax=Pantoea piersonii TaxID=2364647 RepID=UPI000EA1ED10|nr:hypothetical protein [Pantoea piersonii]MBZ6386811.1 hypothetical protein [Pantoea piersonii]MBZ6400040.1 hypothetical protein [Pantoea piersonii]MBZ6409094.1 hypothetical protein [Pantoea piersonii]MBZ6426091.1 hypothetical protein [Pantoea piersonii]NYB04684.1 hypothetical protein [Pantoea piersonii]
MDRQIVYPGQIPLETDLLNTNKFAMTGLAKLASAILGENTWLYGLACKPTAPASMSIQIGEGQIYSLEHIDGSPYSSLDADNTNTILKQGLNMAPRQFRLNAPTQQGYSITYLIQVAYGDVDTGPAVLPYYNAANPAIAYSGPSNAGNAQNTVRAGVCEVRIKPGTPVLSGAQVTPEPDAGYTRAWVITVNYGATAIHADDIRPAAGSPFLPENGLVTALQQGSLTFGHDTGTDNQCVVNLEPAIQQVRDGTRLYFRVKSTNTGAASLKVNSFSASRILTPNHEALCAGQLISGHIAEVEWYEAINAWILRSSSVSYSKQESDRLFLPVSGGHVTGNISIDGSLSAGHGLKVGKAEITTGGDIKGEQWHGSLYKWLDELVPVLSGSELAWYYYGPGRKLIIQGGKASRSGNTTRVTFPVVFPAKCLHVQTTLCAAHKKSTWNVFVSNIENSQFNIIAGTDEPEFYWLAIGK